MEEHTELKQSVTVIKTAVSASRPSFDKLYEYTLPSELEKSVSLGTRVLIPFGKGNRRCIGVVLGIYETKSRDPRLKPALKLMDEEPLVNREAIELIFWLKENTFCTYYEAYRTIVPLGFDFNMSRHFSLVNAEVEDKLTEPEVELLGKFTALGTQRERDELFELALGGTQKKAALGLIDKGVVERTESLKRRVGDETTTMVRLTDAFLDAEVRAEITRRQRSVVDFLAEYGSASMDETVYMTGASKDIIKRLCKNGVAESFKVQSFRTPDSTECAERNVEDIKLSSEQQAAFDGILELVRAGKACGSLLYGVTGSGKTLVFIKLIDEVLKLGKTALMLVPEISLTPQTVGRFKSLFGDSVAVVHSGLSIGQRTDEFKRIRQGLARIVIGTRSAVFSPLENIGIIIIDEEGESTYKSESSPRYHARDVAIRRCGYNSAVLLMASATPSIETYYYAKTGRFHLFELPKRYNNSRLPETEIVDMKNEPAGSELSAELAESIKQCHDEGRQSIILLNRRGYNSFAVCLECRQPISCPNCNLPLTYHKKNDRLMCHYCGFSRKRPTECDHCHSTHLGYMGTGTQRVEEELKKRFPELKILRMDADTTTSKYAYEKGFEAFGKGEYDMMVGTQMIAKGLDFENVTLVGVASLDKSLYMGGFKSYERTFSLLTQVIGRCGRGSFKGKAVIQTFSPEHYIIELAAKQDYKGFYEGEIELRRALLYPPFCDICVVGFSSESESLARGASKEFVRILKVLTDEISYTQPLRTLGPAPCVIARLNGKYRFRLILKCKNTKAFRELLAEALKRAYKSSAFSGVYVYADINGDTEG